MTEIKKNFLDFLKNRSYIASIILVSILSFCFLLTHATVNTDTLAFDRYFSGTELFAQKRFAAPILERIFHIFNYNPFFVDFVAILLLIVSSILFCSFIKKITSNKINNISYIIFSCLFISYSLLPEIFTYTPMGLCIALGYIFTYLSIILVYEFLKHKNIKHLIFSCLLVTFAIALYESFASVYVLGVFIVFIVESIYNNKSFKDLLKNGLLFCVILVIGIVLKSIIANLILIMFNIEKSLYSDKNIIYTTTGVINGIKTLIKTLYNNYFLKGLFYFPITMFIISVLINTIMIIKKIIKKNNAYVWLLGAVIATISLSLIKGISAPYRTCQTFALFVAFTFLLLSNYIIKSKTKKIFKDISIVAIFILIFYQCYDMHNWFYTNYLRNEDEKNTLIYIGNRLENEFDISKPIVIIGSYKLNNNIINRIYMNEETYRYKIYRSLFIESANTPFIRQIGETNVNSYIYWGIGAFGSDTEINKWWELLGYDFKIGTIEMKNEAKSYLPKCTKKSCIYETEKYIVIHLN